MSIYNLYFMNADSGHIERVHEFEASDHSEAMKITSEFECRQPMELWCEHHKIHRYEAITESMNGPDPTLLSRWLEQRRA